MARITYEVLQKPIDKRLEEAACIYYEVEAAFFSVHKKDGNTEKRRVLFWLLKQDGGLDLTTLANRYGLQKQSMQEALNKIEFQIGVYLTISRDVDNIRNIAANLVAKMIVMDVKLEQFLAPPPNS